MVIGTPNLSSQPRLRANWDKSFMSRNVCRYPSKNARVITVRAGGVGARFSGITQFIDEYARRTILCAERINQASSELSRRSIRHPFMNQVVKRLAGVIEKKREKSESIQGCHTVSMIFVKIWRAKVTPQHDVWGQGHRGNPRMHPRPKLWLPSVVSRPPARALSGGARRHCFGRLSSRPSDYPQRQ